MGLTVAKTTLIRGARVIDGTGLPARVEDVVIRDGRFVPDTGTAADDIVDADGLVAAPGFVDIHTHYDAQVFWDALLSPSPQHGVTTVIGGNCGFTLAPMDDAQQEYIARMLARVEGMPYEALAETVPWGWHSFGELLDALETRGVGLNLGLLAGHSTIRRLVMGPRATGETATAGETARMAGVLDEALRSGALGLSTSQAATQPDADNQPVPSRWADTDEMLALASRVREHPGTMLQYAPPGDRFDDASVALMVALSRVADRPINWNLLIVGRYDADYCEHQLAASGQGARAGAAVRGLIRPDPTVFRLSFVNCRTMTAFKHWNELDLPADSRRLALGDPTVRRSLKQRAESSVRGRVSAELYVRWGDYLVGDTAQDSLRGRTIGDIAAERQQEPFDTLLDIALAEDLTTGFYPQSDDGGVAGWAARARLCADPRMIVGGSDAGGHLDMMCGPVYTTALLSEYPRRGLLSLEECVRLITDVPARYIGLRGRGRIADGYHADLVLFDPDEIAPGPLRFVKDLPAGGSRVFAPGRGITHVFVNGTPVLSGGRLGDVRPGVVLRSGRDTRTFDNAAALAAG
jgi:N-acyl-D-aspartate/D-glutamate deacylase